MPEEATAKKQPRETPPDEPAKPGDVAEQRIARTLQWALPIVTVASAVVVGFLYDTGVAILVLAGGTLLGVIAVLWASVRTLSGDAPITLEEAIALGAPSAVEEQKRAILQALKDLE